MKKNVIIIGATGRMGRRLVALVLQSDDLNLVGAIEYPNAPTCGEDAASLAGLKPFGILVTDKLQPLMAKADVVIDFSTANMIDHARIANEYHVPFILGTTALSNDELAQLKTFSQTSKIIAATNMSVGVNLLFHLVKEVAQCLSDDYDIEILEMHHNLKKDAPSGTAVTLSERICEAKNWNVEEVVKHGRHGIVGARTKKEIGMHAIRGGDVIGDHTVIFASNGERIELTHKASNRDTFAMGALTAARFITQKSLPNGLYNMQDVLNIK